MVPEVPVATFVIYVIAGHSFRGTPYTKPSEVVSKLTLGNGDSPMGIFHSRLAWGSVEYPRQISTAQGTNTRQ